jgi:predicted ATPase/DNA-binding winged helix-turn-helix (wHTH) protein
MTTTDAALFKEDDPDETKIAFGPFRLCAAERLIERSGEPLALGGRAMDILIALVERAGEVVSQRELIDRVWSNVTVDDSNLRYHVAALRRALGDGQDGARYVINVPGRGYCFVGSTTAQSPAGEPAPAPKRRVSAVHSLPSRLKRMVGRETAVEAIAAQLARTRFVTIVGPGGIGKTTVAIAVGHALAAEHGEACFVDLGPLADPSLVPSLLATALGLMVQSDNLTRDLIDFLRDKRMLLILDGCEHVVETAAGLVETIFEQAEEVHVLATSREALRIEGEQVHYLVPLECPPASDTLTAAESLAFPAAQLFSDRVAATSDRFVLGDRDAPLVARICRKLDGIALAIELAAGRVNAHGIEGVDALLDSKLSLLWQGRRTAPPRHQTLKATLDWSYELLTEIEQTILRRLAVFAGPFNLEAARAVAEGCGPEAGEFTEVVAQLVAKSLIESDAGGGRGARYRVLDTTRTYLQAKLAGADEADMVARRHAEFFCNLLKRVSAQTPASAEARRFRAYGEYIGNVRSALEWSFSERGDVGFGVALAAAAAALFLERSLLTECRRWTGTALAAHAASGGDPQWEMELQASFGLSRLLTEGNSATVRDILKRALELAEGLGELSTQLQVLGSLHLFYCRTADFRGAVGVAERALDVAAKLGDPTGLAVAESMLGTSHHLIGNHTSALIHCRSAVARPGGAMLDIARSGFDYRIRARGPLSQALWLHGAVDEAANTARHALSEAEALEHPVTLCILLIYTTFVFLWSGEWSEAEALVERLTSESEKYSLGPYSAVAMGFRGELAIRRGDAPAAIPVLVSCLQTMRLERHEVFASAFISALAEAMAMAGRLDEALSTIEEAISEVEGRGGSYHLADMWRLKGDFLLSMDSSNAAEAGECFLRSLDIARRQGALSWELRTATAMARLRAGQGRVGEAREELASIFGRLTQGKGTIDLRAAGSLLDELA